MFSVDRALIPALMPTNSSTLERAFKCAVIATSCGFLGVFATAVVELGEWHVRESVKDPKTKHVLGKRPKFYKSTFSYMGKTVVAIFGMTFVGMVVYPKRGRGGMIGF